MKKIIIIVLTTIIVSAIWLGLTYSKTFKPPLIKWTDNHDWENLKTCFSYRSEFTTKTDRGYNASYRYIFCLKDDKTNL